MLLSLESCLLCFLVSRRTYQSLASWLDPWFGPALAKSSGRTCGEAINHLLLTHHLETLPSQDRERQLRADACEKASTPALQLQLRSKGSSHQPQPAWFSAQPPSISLFSSSQRNLDADRLARIGIVAQSFQDRIRLLYFGLILPKLHWVRHLSHYGWIHLKYFEFEAWELRIVNHLALVKALDPSRT